MGIRGYIQRVQAARREEQVAQTALAFDYDDRLEHNGPWGEDETYLRLNDNAAHASAHLLHVVLRRDTSHDPHAVCKDGMVVQVGMVLRHCTQTERGAALADAWDREHGIDTASIDIEP